MTLFQLVVGGGVVLSVAMLGVLASLWPSEPRPRPLCLKARPDAGCSPRCLRVCPVLSAA